MYDIYLPAFGLKFVVNVGKYTIHGSYGNKPQNYNAATPSIAKVDRRLKIEGPSDAGDAA